MVGGTANLKLDLEKGSLSHNLTREERKCNKTSLNIYTLQVERQTFLKKKATSLSIIRDVMQLMFSYKRHFGFNLS